MLTRRYNPMVLTQNTDLKFNDTNDSYDDDYYSTLFICLCVSMMMLLLLCAIADLLKYLKRNRLYEDEVFTP